ncbi:MAG TPA: NAD-dependent epimerase/dehydratase family protein [Gemmatimonadales bacterium]|jgi:nucleoside-diphosphate-sugar epimerase
MRALVTGAQGFIGRAVVAGLHARGWQVTALDLTGPSAPLPGVDVVTADIRRLDGWRSAIERAEVILHLASAHLQVNLPESVYWETNVKSLRPFLEAARAAGVKHFVHTSSVGVHGSLAVVPGNEDSPFAPENLYEKTKAAGEAEVTRFIPDAGSMGVTIVRPGWVYGPGDPRTEKILGAVARGRFVIFGGGKNQRHPIYIDDYVEGMAQILLKPQTYGRTYVLAGPSYLSSRELVQAAEQVTGGRTRLRVPLPVGYAAGLGAEMVCKVLRASPPISRRTLAFFTNQNAFDTARARREFGFAPPTGIVEGFRRVWESMGRNGPTRGH